MNTKKTVTLALLSAIAIASRYALSAFPNFKPVLAIVVIAGVAFSWQGGVLVGSVTMLLSNFIFGQGPHTPYQMFAMALVGFLAGIVFKKVPVKIYTLAIFGGLATMLIYAPIMNFYSMTMMSKEISLRRFLLFEMSGLPFDIPHAIASVIFLGVLGVPLLKIIKVSL
ncbi:hypothetical protein FACS1894132_09530 [Clostridia bacterium]|nr:hypothetical protein FACS1894132_09530 [Clostridia bacterium]